MASSALSQAIPQQGQPKVTPDILIQDARAADYEAIFFPGGTNLEYIGNRPGAAPARKLIADMLAANKHVTALTGVSVLADAGVLEGKKSRLRQIPFGQGAG